jgi:hypothetical protein
MAFAALPKAWITAIFGRQDHPRNLIGTNVPIAKPINPTPMGLRLNPIIEKKTDQRRAGNHR